MQVLEGGKEPLVELLIIAFEIFQMHRYFCKIFTNPMTLK